MIKIKKYQIEDYISDATQDALDLKADLVDGKVPESQLPAFVNDVIEVANYAALPDPGTSGIIYITTDNNKLYRWGGSAYTEIASGVTNLSYTPGVSNGVVNSDTGTDATIPLADATNAGLFSAAEKSKLDGLNAQNLQEVTDEGAITTNTITVDSVNYYSLIEPQDIGTENKITGSYAFLGGDGVVGISNGTSESEIKNTNVTNGGVILEFPDKVGSSYTIATTEDYDLQSVLDNGNTATEQEIHLINGAENNDVLTIDVITGDGGYKAIKVNYDYPGDSASTAVQFTSNGTESPDEPGTGKTLEVNNTSSGAAIEAYSLNGKPIVTYGNGSVAIESNLGSYGKGLVINSGTSSTGVPLTINKNGVDKLVVNQAGEITATKLIKQGGTSSQFLMADGSVTTSSGGATNLSYTASPTNGIVNSSTGTGATIPLATATNAGLLKPAKFTVLENTSGTNTGDQDLSGLVVKNAAITGATKTKITYDTKGLVTAGADATTADIADSTDKRYQNDNQKLYNDATSSIQTQLNAKVSGVTATSPITSSGGTSPVISTSMSTNKLIGRSTAGTGVMEQITVGSGLTLSAGTLTNTATPTPTGYYGAWQDNVTQTAAASNTGYAMIFRTIDLANGVSVVTNGTNLTRITFANTGIYNLQFSSQFQNLSNSPQDVTIWLRLNGTDVSGSAGIVGLEARKNPGDPYHIVTGWNYVLSVVAGQYYELMWSTTDHTNVQMQFYAAGSPPPSAASVIMTVTQQSGIMAGTGVTAINSLTGSTQTLTVGTTGTDFAIVSSGSTHTFNLPTADATNRGALSTTDWSNFNTAYTDRLKWDGGATGLTAATGRTSLGLGTFAVANYPTWVSNTPFVKMTAAGTFSLDNSTYLTSAVTSVGGTGTVAGLTLTGTVTSTGNLTLGGTLSTPVSTINDSTTVGQNFVKLTNPSAITFTRINADNTVSTLDAATFRTAIGAGTGTVTSVTGTAPVVSSGGTTPAISMAAATTSVNGYLTSTDWNTFNNKVSAQTGQIIITSGTTSFTTPATGTLSTVYIFELVGGGGGGGGGLASSGNGSGGGAGGYVYKRITGLTGGNTYAASVVVGAGGTGTSTNGNAGASTTLNILSVTYTASGGGGGIGAVSSAGGAGGTGTNGDINITGQSGGDSLAAAASVPSSAGGSSPKGWGLGGLGVLTPKNGNNATGYGAGGSAGKGTTGTPVGGNGSAGIIMVTWFN